MIKTPIIVILISLFFHQLQAQVSVNPELIRSTTSISGTSKEININNHNFVVQHSIGQASVIGTFSGPDYVLRQGFIQPNSKINQTYIIDIQKNKALLSINIYPNPFSKYIFLEFNEVVSGKIKVEIYDISGRMIFTEDYETLQNITLRPQILSGAQYILKVTANNKHFIEKILKN